MFTEKCLEIFNKCIRDYHLTDDIDAVLPDPYPGETEEQLLYHKCWIDTVQWHLEDVVRDPGIDPGRALEIKRRIDRSNQERTDKVEQLDDRFLEQLKAAVLLPAARLNTESPAWAVDRLSILCLKIYHMQEEVDRKDADPAHIRRCSEKLHVLQQQQKDLCLAIEQLLEDLHAGRRVMKVYRQMKMYNDPSLNPVLYGNKKG